MRVKFLGREDPLEKEMATHSNIPAWETPWTEGPGRLQSMDCKELDRTEQLNKNKVLSWVGEGHIFAVTWTFFPPKISFSFHPVSPNPLLNEPLQLVGGCCSPWL